MVHQRVELDDFQEQVLQIRDDAADIRGYIVVHSTALGPAAGGCRLWKYESDREMLLDGIRLARGMTYKNALAGLPFGGGKAVLQLPGGKVSREKLFRVLGEAVQSLDGRYITAEDVGTTVRDMQNVREHTSFVSGIASRSDVAGGDPSPWTALTVFQSLKVAVKLRLGTDLKGLRVGVQGTGNVGLALCSLLHGEGANLVVADTDNGRAEHASHRFGATVTSPQLLLQEDIDVLSPCALGGVLDDHVLDALKAVVVCGAANNQLARPDCATWLEQLGITYAPDYVVNAGGIISVAAEYLAESKATARKRMDLVPARLAQILSRARSEGSTPLEVANQMARECISQRWAEAA